MKREMQSAMRAAHNAQLRKTSYQPNTEAGSPVMAMKVLDVLTRLRREVLGLSMPIAWRRARTAVELVGFSLYSPPFSHLFIYSDSERDMGNAADDAEFLEHYGFLLRELATASPSRAG
jgi:hypothetical protein